MTEDRLRQLAKVALDVATSSNDFASGFLDNEEVEALRELATMLGVDPMTVTPEDFKPTYCPGHEWSEWKPQWTVGGVGGGRWRRCQNCGKTQVEGETVTKATR